MALQKATTPKKVAPRRKVVTPAATTAPAPVAGTEGTYQGYCVKCKEKNVSFKGAVVVSKTGMNMAQGPCPTCGTKMSRILGKAK